MENTTKPTRHRWRARPAILRGAAVALVVVALAAAGCGDDDDAEAGGSGGGTGGGDEALSIEIASPADGDEVGSTFDVTVEPSVDIGEPDTGLHHVHLFYDGNTTDGEYDMAFGPEFTVDHLDPGQHTIEAVVVNADHSVTDARAEVTVTVGDTPAQDTTTTTEPDDDSGGVGGY